MCLKDYFPENIWFFSKLQGRCKGLVENGLTPPHSKILGLVTFGALEKDYNILIIQPKVEKICIVPL